MASERDTPGDPLLTTQQLAARYQVTTRTIERWTAAGMPSEKLAGIRRYRAAETEAWLRERAVHRGGGATA